MVSEKVEGHEDLSGCDDAGDAQFNIADGAAARDNVDAVVRPKLQAASTGFISSHALGTMLSSIFTLAVLVRVCPMLDGAACIEDEVVLFVRLLDERQTRNGIERSFAGGGGKDAVGVEAVATPLYAAFLFKLLPGEFAVVAHAAGGDTLPLFEGVVRGVQGSSGSMKALGDMGAGTRPNLNLAIQIMLDNVR